MGHIKTTEEEKNFTIAVSANWSGMQLFLQPSSLFIRKKKTYSHLMASQWTISHHKQHTRLPLAPSHMAPGRHRDTEEPRDSRISTTISLCCRKPACGARKRLTQSKFSAHQHAPWNKGTCLSSNAHVLTITPTFSPPSLLALEPSCLIKSISCASAVPRQMTFKQVL